MLLSEGLRKHGWKGRRPGSIFWEGGALTFLGGGTIYLHTNQ